MNEFGKDEAKGHITEPVELDEFTLHVLAEIAEDDGMIDLTKVAVDP